MSASVGLCVVFYQLQTVAFTNLPYSFGIGATPVEMHQQHGLGALRDAVGYQPVVYLQCPDVGFHQHGLQSALRDGQDAGDVGVGRNDDFVALVQKARLLIGPENE